MSDTHDTNSSPAGRGYFIVFGLCLAAFSIFINYQLFDTLAPEITYTATVISKDVEQSGGKFVHTYWMVTVSTSEGNREVWLTNYEAWKAAKAGDRITKTERLVFSRPTP